MNDLGNRKYTGTGKRQYKPLKDAWDQPEPYIASKELAEAVNMARYLRRPLLLEGEPGCGKIRLAYAVAYELGYPLQPIYIRSTSRAQDLLYTFDAVRRLYDIQERAASRPVKTTSNVGKRSTRLTEEEKEEEKRKYIKLGKLGEAIALSQQDIPSVVLIDEIDKADIDFPNDLLLVLDRLQFEVEEIPGWKFDAFKGQSREERRDFLPFVIVTSNREKELPAPFLRRCLFYYIDFPKPKELKKIIRSHFRTRHTRIFDEALKKFWELRHQKIFNWRKVPSTSEFLDWISVLERDEQERLLTVDSLVSKSLKELPHLEALLKTQSDRDALTRAQPETQAQVEKPHA